MRGAAPRARGRPAWRSCITSSGGCSPACSGTPPCQHSEQRRDRVQPRVRGDAGRCSRKEGSAWGAAPRARGRQSCATSDYSSGGCSPACAGTPLKIPRGSVDSRVQPRVLGDAAAGMSPDGGGGGAAPRARGRHVSKYEGEIDAGCSPACSGTPAPPPHRTGVTELQPRVLGDAVSMANR